MKTNPTTEKSTFIPALILGLITWGYCLVNALTRSYFNGNTESDFVLSYIGEASRILQGQAPLVSHHPPFYPYLIAWVYRIASDWLLTGLAVTWVSLAGCLFLNYRLFKELAGSSAGAGAVLSFLASPILLTYASMATSDLFFLLLYTLCLCTVYAALKKDSLAAWGFAGLVLGITFLSRTNAITLLILFLVPLFGTVKPLRKTAAVVAMGTAFLLPMLVWYFYSRKMGTAFMPSGTYANLAMTYFSPGSDRMSADAYILAKEKFTSLIDVVTYDPLRMLRIYIIDFAAMIAKNAFLLVSPLVTLAALAGIRALPETCRCSRENTVLILFVFLALLTQTLLTNLKTYEYRYYIFWLPVLGALAGLGIEKAAAKTQNPRKAFLIITAVFALLALPFSVYKSYSVIHSPFQRELAAAIEEVQKHVPASGILVGRKSHLSYYTDRDYLFIPNSSDLAHLRTDLEKLREEGRDLYLFFGYYEAATRPGLRMLLNPSQAPYWLEPVAGTRKNFPWNLYLVRVPTDYESELLEQGKNKPL